MKACYNCNGINTIFQLGEPVYGCLLCKTYGDGNGNIKIEMRNKAVEIEGMYFRPPKYVCIFCRDTKIQTKKVWIDNLKEPSYSDKGWCKMPITQMTCKNCEFTS